jgi:aerobic-type carbon monoxide dehydrogenase small subunit (CoxS/CutS family)
MSIRFTVNGLAQEVDDGRGEDRLLDFLHDDLNLTGTKFCCGIGVCRACTVSVAKAGSPAETPVISCSTALASLDGAVITTIEGVSQGADILPIQQAFLTQFAFQCGYCTPGFVMASKIFLDQLALASPPADLDDAIERAIG